MTVRSASPRLSKTFQCRAALQRGSLVLGDKRLMTPPSADPSSDSPPLDRSRLGYDAESPCG